ncbi:hypothetical protein B0H16DRAFT_1477341 [Mycena metata]|uniref:Uncharacterized protein n=1 Tax=Mycena metata TaxID=1033252 RepID=A0AAD7HAK7_9AGAR|nr:hypothetical protein B0H16DRAFT_1477341 [Mycena metata]
MHFVLVTPPKRLQKKLAEGECFFSGYTPSVQKYIVQERYGQHQANGKAREVFQGSNLASIYQPPATFGLFHAWEVDGEIPDVDAEPSASNTKNAVAQAAQEKLVQTRLRENLLAKNPDASEEELEEIKTVQMDRSLRRHYDAVVQFTAGVRILTSNTISPNEVGRGCKTVQRAVQLWAAMNCHLVPYFHYMAAHLEPQFLKHGPIPGWWTFPYERNNGFLGRFNHNGHSGGEIEGTMMRGWWKTTLIQDLISRLEEIENPAPEDVASLAVLKSYLKGGTSERKGTLQNYICRVQTESNPHAVELSKFPKQQSLRELGHGYYHLVFEYLKALWAAHATLVLDVELEKAGEHSLSGDVQSYSHGWVHRRRHGAATQHRGQSAQYAYIDHRIPVQIRHIFRVEERFTDTQTLTANLAIVRRFQEDPVIFNFPWALWATDIGVQVWQANIFGRSEFLSAVVNSG